MQIKDLFFHRINRKITTVIKVDDRDEAQMAEELQEYIPTNIIERELIRFLEAYVATRPGQSGAGTDDIGVWISGFFGSGKSHFAKIISYLLANPTVEGRTAHDWFMERVAGSDLAAEIQGLLVQLRNYLHSQPIMFQIKAEQKAINPDSITEIMYRQYLRARGLSETPWIGRFELSLIERGKYDAFKEEIARLTGESWEASRDEHLLVRTDITRAVQRVLPDRYPDAEAVERALTDVERNLDLSAVTLARELAGYVQARDEADPARAFHLVYIIDEMGQFIGDDGQKLLELQSVAETFATHGAGRLWLLVTAQEALEEVVEGVRRRKADYARIMDRFALQIKLTSEDVEQVLEQRILRKKETARSPLTDLYHRHQGNILEIAGLEAKRPIENRPDAARFYRTYPFLPYHFDLMQQAFAGLRAKGGSATQLSGGERSMLGVTQGVLAAPNTDLAQRPVGRLVCLDQLYDQIIKEVPAADARAINSVADQSFAGAIHPARVLKSLFILQHVEWVPGSLDNLARALSDEVGAHLAQTRAEVKEALDVLVSQQYASESDGVYKYLSAAERDIEQEIAAESVKNEEVRRAAREMLGDLLSNTGRLNYKGNTATFDFSIVADGQELRGRGELTLQVYSPIYVEFGNVDPELVRDMTSPHEPHTVYWLPAAVTSLAPDFRRLLRTRKVLRRRETRSSADRVEAIILRDKHREVDLIESRLKSALSRALAGGSIVHQGDESDLDGRSSNLNVIFNRELAGVIPQVYTQFYKADVKVQESGIDDMLTTRAANLPDVAPALDLWDESGAEPRINTTTPVVSEILSELEQRADRGEDLSGRALSRHFESIPYGWNPILLRIVLAALFRAGRLTVEYEGKRYDFSSRRGREALTRARAFNRAVFRPEKGLSLEERRQAKRQLHLHFDRRGDDTPNTLASGIQAELAELVAAGERLRLQCSAAHLPVKEILYKGQAQAAQVLEQREQTAQIRAFLEAAETLGELRQYQRQLDDFVGAGRLPEFERARELLHAIERAQRYVPELQSEAIRDRVADMRQIAADRAVVERWDHYAECYSQVLRAYQEAYQRLFQARHETYSQIRDELAPLVGEVPASITGFIAENGPVYQAWAEDRLHYQGVAATLADLYLQIQGADSARAQALEQLDGNGGDGDGDDGNGGDQPPRPVVIRLSDILPRRTFEEPAQLEAVIDALRRQVGQKLEEGRTVILS